MRYRCSVYVHRERTHLDRPAAVAGCLWPGTRHRDLLMRVRYIDTYVYIIMLYRVARRVFPFPRFTVI